MKRLALTAVLIACSSTDPEPPPVPEDVPPTVEDVPQTVLEGQLLVLTYNVAGLPQGISKSDPEAHIPQISPLLNAFDLVLAQEDFWYHHLLSADVDHPHRSQPWREELEFTDIGDGLNRFSRSPFTDHQRTAWPGCNGQTDCASDCLATKGFAYARHDLADGALLDVYNLHNEAGGCDEDEAIREQSTTLLLATIEERSAGTAVLVAGDFNLHADDAVDQVQLQRLADAGFADACTTVACGNDRIDRIFVRSGGDITLEVTTWEVPPAFVTAAGEDLSDHKPVAATIRWTRAP